MENSSLRNYQKIIQLFQYTAIGMGHDIYRNNYNVGFLPILVNVLVVCEFFSISLTSLTSLADLKYALQSISTIGLPIQNMVKFGTLLYYRKDLWQLHEFVTNMLRTSQGPYNLAFNKWMGHIFTVAKLQAIIYFGTASAAFAFPIVYYLYSHEKGYIVLCFLPYFDRASVVGYTLNTIYQFVLGLITLGALYSVDLLFITLLFTGAAYIDIVRLDCDALTEELLKTGKERNEKKVSQLLRALLVRGQEMDIFLQTVYALFEKGACIQIYASAFSLSICVLVALVTTWFAAYMFIICFGYIIMIYSVLGTVVEVKYEELCDYAYTIPWYELSNKEKRMFLLFLQHLQRSVGLKLFGSLCLNVATGSGIFKTIYQGFMVIRDFI